MGEGIHALLPPSGQLVVERADMRTGQAEDCSSLELETMSTVRVRGEF
jgi:hypothetical protein